MTRPQYFARWSLSIDVVLDCPGFFSVVVNVPTDILRACCCRVTPRGLSKRHGLSSHVGHEFALFQTMKAVGVTMSGGGVAWRLRLF